MSLSGILTRILRRAQIKNPVAAFQHGIHFTLYYYFHSIIYIYTLLLLIGMENLENEFFNNSETRLVVDFSDKEAFMKWRVTTDAEIRGIYYFIIQNILTPLVKENQLHLYRIMRKQKQVSLFSSLSLASLFSC